MLACGAFLQIQQFDKKDQAGVRWDNTLYPPWRRSLLSLSGVQASGQSGLCAAVFLSIVRQVIRLASGVVCPIPDG
jgi:hypothetical protein